MRDRDCHQPHNLGVAPQSSALGAGGTLLVVYLIINLAAVGISGEGETFLLHLKLPSFAKIDERGKASPLRRQSEYALSASSSPSPSPLRSFPRLRQNLTETFRRRADAAVCATCNRTTPRFTCLVKIRANSALSTSCSSFVAFDMGPAATCRTQAGAHGGGSSVTTFDGGVWIA